VKRTVAEARCRPAPALPDAGRFAGVADVGLCVARPARLGWFGIRLIRRFCRPPPSPTGVSRTLSSSGTQRARRQPRHRRIREIPRLTARLGKNWDVLWPRRRRISSVGPGARHIVPADPADRWRAVRAAVASSAFPLWRPISGGVVFGRNRHHSKVSHLMGLSAAWSSSGSFQE
jgi:hypothetical protein